MPRPYNRVAPYKKGPEHHLFGQLANKVAKATKSPTLADLAWAAGFLEGEGHFAGSYSKTQTVRACQVQREPLERLQAVFGGNIPERKYWNYAAAHNSQPIYRWSISGARARGVMMTLFTFMSPWRQQQILTALR